MKRSVKMLFERTEQILASFSSKRIAVIGDFFLDRYWLIDPTRNEPSIETGLTAYQIIGRRRSPGAAGTVMNNLHALGIGTLYAVGMTGVDGEGLELRMELTNRKVDLAHLYAVEERFTPTYTKPMLLESAVGYSPKECSVNDKSASAHIEPVSVKAEPEKSVIEKELNRFDLKNRKPLPPWVEYQIEKALESLADKTDAILVMDQVSESNCGIITDRVREKLIVMGQNNTPGIIYADSRDRIDLFSHLLIKCNQYELVASFDPDYDRINGSKKSEEPSDELIEISGLRMCKKTAKPVFVTLGSRGIWIFEPEHSRKIEVPAIPVTGPIDICGAGDAASAGIVAALTAGATLAESALIGNLAASIAIQQIGTTGTATPKQILQALQS